MIRITSPYSLLFWLFSSLRLEACSSSGLRWFVLPVLLCVSTASYGANFYYLTQSEAEAACLAGGHTHGCSLAGDASGVNRYLGKNVFGTQNVYWFNTGCVDGVDVNTGECVIAPPDDEECLSRSNQTHVTELTPAQMFSGQFPSGVNDGECGYSLDMESEQPVDCYQKSNGNFQCYLDMAPTGVADSDLDDLIAPIEGDGDTATIEEGTETDNEAGTTTETETTIDKEPDGSIKTTETETVTEQDGTITVTETTTINNIDGTTTTITNTTVTNPDGTTETTISGQKTESDETKERQASTNDCGQPVQCKGDAINCAILKRIKANYCEAEQDMKDAASQLREQTSGVGELGDPNLDLTDSTEINVSDQISGWQDVADPTPAQCPAPRELKLGMGTFSVKWEPWCEFAQQIRPFTIFMFSFIGAMAIARTFVT